MTTSQTPQTQPKSDDPLAITAMVLGVVSLTGLGFVAGIPAIILASIALARKTPSRGLSLAGLITGIISTVLSIIAVLFFILLVVLAASSPEFIDPGMPIPSEEQLFSQGRA